MGAPGWGVLADGMGLFGPPLPIAFDANGRFELPGFVLLNPSLGLSLTVQGVHFDPSAPLGWRIQWARFPDDL